MKTSDVELGFLALPERGPSPGVVMIHDVWGLSAHTRDYAARLAREGFAVLAIDLYRRAPPAKIEDPGAWIRALPDPQVLSDLGAGARFLAALPETNSRVGVLGFCMGGMYALKAAAQERFTKAVSFYGMIKVPKQWKSKKQGEPLDLLAERGASHVMQIMGDSDEWVSVDNAKELEALGAAVVIYKGGGHGFVHDPARPTHREKDAADAWKRAKKFLGL